MSESFALRRLTPEWLTGVLRRSGALPAGRVVGVRSEPIGTFSSLLSRVYPSYDGAPAGCPESLVMKAGVAGRPERLGESFSHEIRFYAELANRVPARIPRFHHGHVGESTGEALLLLEDVRGVGPTDWKHGPSERHAELAVDAMARLHAEWWQQVEVIAWIPSFGDEALLDAFDRAYARNWPVRRGFFHEIVPAFTAIGDALRGRLASSHRRLAEEPTLLHGDAHAENMPLVPELDSKGAGSGEEVVLLDWAGPRRGSSGVDLGFFIPMSFPTERRRLVERSLVARHHQVLRDRGVEPGIDPWLGYRRGVLRRISRIVGIADRWDPEALGSLKMIFARCANAAVELDLRELIE